MQKPNKNHTSNNNKHTNHVGENCVFHNSNGITLIALIITIIIMIILVGVTVNIALNGGLFDVAETAAEGTKYQADYETLQTAIAASLDENLTIPTVQKLRDNLPEGWEVEGTDGVEYIVTSPNGNTFMVDANANIEDYVKVEKVMDEYPGDITDNGTRDGTESNPYMINSMEDLVAFGELVDMGETYEGKIVKLGYNLDFKSNNSYVNPNDPYTSREKGEQIDINEDGTVESIKTELTTGKGFNGIGEIQAESGSGPITREVSFKGTFDGNGKVIINFYQNVMSAASEAVNDIGAVISVSLFAENEGTIKNLGIKTAKNSILTSGIAGLNGNSSMMYDLENANISASIENCFCVLSDGSTAGRWWISIC